jgi:phosphatidylglycerophosphatase A
MTLGRRAALVLATGFGSGYSPVAPGTAGSAVGVLLFLPLVHAPLRVQLAAVVVVYLLGVAASKVAAEVAGRKDPGIAVVDEIVGQWITYLALPFTPATALAGFVLFRVMDVVKPWPARQLEALPGGWGIMTDDVFAGIWANLALRAALVVVPFA